jgi:hypothetical protein
MEKKMKRMLVLLLLAGLCVLGLAACGAADMPAVPAVTPSQSLPLPADLRDWRYCEVIPVFQHGLKLHVEVYNTLGLNDCPGQAWAGLDASALAKQLGARLVKLNGPRYWVIDAISGGGSTLSGYTAEFGGIQMTQRATLDTYLWQATIGDKAYTPNQVKRTTEFTYFAGQKIYELISPAGETYVMQSYSQIVDPNLTLADLDTLGSRLTLPQGWHYTTEVLAQDLVLKANGVAYVINDELLNTYQKRLP